MHKAQAAIKIESNACAQSAITAGASQSSSARGRLSFSVALADLCGVGRWWLVHLHHKHAHEERGHAQHESNADDAQDC